jgi:GDP-4-dehydro-6-deoxy-D-mannose reductase
MGEDETFRRGTMPNWKSELEQHRTVMVTGARGFVGRHLVEELLRTSVWRVLELVRRPTDEGESDYRRRLVADITDAERVQSVLEQWQPDYVFHLAAATPPATCRDLFAVNVGGTSGLLDAVVTRCPNAAVLVVGSDAQYGRLDPAWLPTPESAPQRPIGAYGRSKLLQELIARRLGAITNTRIICVRPFNHIGPGQSERFVVPTIAKQIALAERGLGTSVIKFGDGDAMRDFTDVRDVVRAYVEVLLRGSAGAAYNVGSGVSRRIRDMAAMLAALATTPVTLRAARTRSARGEVLVTCCDASRLRRRTGWAPRARIEQTLADTLEYWRAVLASQQRAPLE